MIVKLIRKFFFIFYRKNSFKNCFHPDFQGFNTWNNLIYDEEEINKK
jgi:hypothetical protein